MKDAIAVTLSAVVLFIAAAAGVLLAASIADIPVAPVVQVEEDDPRFDCRTMGNRTCGPDSKPRPQGGYW